MINSRGLFAWAHFAKQKHSIIAWYKELVPSESWDKAIRDPEQYLSEEYREQNRTDSIKLRLTQRFKETYQKIRLFHACCPSDVGEYLRKGLIPLDVEAANKLARTLFLSAEYPLVTEELLNEAIAGLRGQNRGGYLYLSLDDSNLIMHANHYLIYGSEYLAAIAFELSRQTGEDCTAALVNIGIPTIFVCDIPTSYTPDLSLQHLIERLIVCAIEDENKEVVSIDFTFTFSVPLSSEFIASHYHPPKIAGEINTRISCPFCRKL